MNFLQKFFIDDKNGVSFTSMAELEEFEQILERNEFVLLRMGDEIAPVENWPVRGHQIGTTNIIGGVSQDSCANIITFCEFDELIHLWQGERNDLLNNDGMEELL